MKKFFFITSAVLLLWSSAVQTSLMEVVSQISNTQEALFQAVRDNDRETAQRSLARGARVDVADSNGKTVFYYLAQIEGDASELKALLIAQKNDDTESDDADQPYWDKQDDESDQRSWSMSDFLSSQYHGASELLSFGRSAVLSALTPAEETCDIPAASNMTGRLIHFFLHDPMQYETVKSLGLPGDIRNLLKNRFLAANNPLKELIKKRLIGPVCLLTLQGKDVYTAHSSLLRCFNAAGTVIVTSCPLNSEIVMIWDLVSGKCLQTLAGHKAPVYSAQFNGAENRLATVSTDGTAKIWNLVSGTCTHNLCDEESPVISAQFNSAGDKVVTSLKDGRAKVWDILSEGSPRSFIFPCRMPTGRFFPAQFNTAGDRLLTADEGGVELWDVRLGSLIDAHVVRCGIRSACFHASEPKVIMGNAMPPIDSFVTSWDFNTGETLNWLPYQHSCLAQFKVVGNKIFITKSSLLRYLDTERRVTFTHSAGSEIMDVQSTSEARIITASKDGQVTLLHPESGQVLCTNRLPGYYVYRTVYRNEICCARFDPMGARLAVTTEDGELKIWHVGDGGAVMQWLQNGCTFEQELLLHCIYETMVLSKLLENRKKRNAAGSYAFLAPFQSVQRLTFDFNKFQHLQPHFETMPIEVQVFLRPFVTKCEKNNA